MVWDDHVINVIGMTVVPAHELCRGQAARQVLTRDTQPATFCRTGGVDDGVVVGDEVTVVDIGADLDIEVRRQPWMREDGGELIGDLLGVGVIRRDPRAHQPVRGGQAVDQRDGDMRTRLQQFGGGIEATGSRAHDGHSERIRSGHRSRRRVS